MGPPSPGEGSPLRHPNVLHVGFSDACKGAVAPRECHVELFSGVRRTQVGGCPCCLELNVPAIC